MVKGVGLRIERSQVRSPVRPSVVKLQTNTYPIGSFVGVPQEGRTLKDNSS